jgi:hypothetical protein
MTLSEMRQGAMDANWGQRKCDLLEAYLADFSVLHSDDLLCSTWAAVWSESVRKGRPIRALIYLAQPQSRNHSTERLIHLRIESFNLDYSSVPFGHVRTTRQHNVGSVHLHALPGFGFLRVERATCFRSAMAAVHNTQGHYLRS